MIRLIKQTFLVIFIYFLAANIAFAQDPLFLHKDDKVPFDGMLLDIDTAQQTRKDLIDLDLNKKLIESYKSSIDLYKANDAIYKDEKSLLTQQNDKLTDQLEKERSFNNWDKIIWATIGLGVGFLAVKAAKGI